VHHFFFHASLIGNGLFFEAAAAAVVGTSLDPAPVPAPPVQPVPLPETCAQPSASPQVPSVPEVASALPRITLKLSSGTASPPPDAPSRKA